VKDIVACPNCGKMIEIESAQISTTCIHCREPLLITPGNRVVLANPIRVYQRSDQEVEASEEESPRISVAIRPPVSAERKKRAAQLAYERMSLQEQLGKSGLIYGVAAIFLGGLVGLFSWLRSEFLDRDWISWLGLALGALLFVFGILGTAWFLRSLWSAQASKREIEEDMKD
jgi:hypothetical protein